MRAVRTPHCASERLIRAGMLTVSDLKSGIRRIWPAAAVMACLYLAYWLVMLLAENTVTPGDRLPVLYLTALFLAFCVPEAELEAVRAAERAARRSRHRPLNPGDQAPR